jgi:hypothetical protein
VRNLCALCFCSPRSLQDARASLPKNVTFQRLIALNRHSNSGERSNLCQAVIIFFMFGKKRVIGSRRIGATRRKFSRRRIFTYKTCLLGVRCAQLGGLSAVQLTEIAHNSGPYITRP